MLLKEVTAGKGVHGFDIKGVSHPSISFSLWNGVGLSDSMAHARPNANSPPLGGSPVLLRKSQPVLWCVGLRLYGGGTDEHMEDALRRLTCLRPALKKFVDRTGDVRKSVQTRWMWMGWAQSSGCGRPPSPRRWVHRRHRPAIEEHNILAKSRPAGDERTASDAEASNMKWLTKFSDDF